MQEVILYSTGCPKCDVLKKKLDDKGVSYIENTSTETMLGLGITQVPVLSIDGELKGFKEAVEWVNER